MALAHDGAAVTLALLRKRAEHNDKEISTLQELSLHQENLSRIELLDNVCRDLKILYLQNNLIGKIENVSRLKELSYLNLALNNVLIVEGLEGCEMLHKLDLTINFIVDIFSLRNLKVNRELRELYLTGNPCASFEGYRAFVVATLPQLASLDGTLVTRSERIVAMQELEYNERRLTVQISQYNKEKAKERAEKRARNHKLSEDGWESGITEITDIGEDEQELLLDEEAQKKFWEEETEHSPEARVALHEHQEKVKKAEELKKNPPKPKKERRFFKEDGTPYNINEEDWNFHLGGQDHDCQNFELDFSCYRYLSTSEIDVDVQPSYVRITVRGKVFQLALPESVNPDAGSAKRSQTTGHLMITMPKVRAVTRPNRPKKPDQAKDAVAEAETSVSTALLDANVGVEKLRVSTIVEDAKKAREDRQASKLLSHNLHRRPCQRENDEGFVDDPDVPPMM